MTLDAETTSRRKRQWAEVAGAVASTDRYKVTLRPNWAAAASEMSRRKRSKVAASAVAFRPASMSSGGSFSVTSSISQILRY
ncbi:hypothetical protein EVAR_19485_1 [Eumeta japonica]|uniref:Uncharacterized protein n=1 Tax=Eumeta variegata TaxID=151549 RepID=A0A4C1VBC9_EUMVA|nr:hypothetical protein EVAR_19485_1 [Eumeta japonica]